MKQNRKHFDLKSKQKRTRNRLALRNTATRILYNSVSAEKSRVQVGSEFSVVSEATPFLCWER